MRLILIFLLALTLRSGLAALRYTDDFKNFENGDYALYSIGGDYFSSAHDFRNSLFLVRPPAYPVLISLLHNDNRLILAADILAGALVAPVAYLLALQLGLSINLSLIAALIVAVDPGSIAYSAFLGPEPFANLLLAAALTALLYAMRTIRRGRVLLWGAISGVLLALASLTRPASYLLWIPLGLWLLITQRKRWPAILVFVLINALALFGWTAHNGQVFGNPAFSTTGPYTMLYYHAAAVEHYVSGKTSAEVFTDINRRIETRLGRDPDKADSGTNQGYLAATIDIQNAETAEALAIFKAYPLLTLATFPLGFVRMFAYTQTLPRWLSVIDIPFNLALLLGTVIGLLLALRRRQWMLFWGVLLTCAYFTAGILLVKTTALDTRERSMLTPLMAAACAYAVAAIYRRWRPNRGLS
ncbi:MAG: phospholipid carrier-dependent glycosyltransferase [Chloroflexi bacterium]|nr:phospholipid carrier-dependent glycosyltransferase [Chloroflexota bacterium]